MTKRVSDLLEEFKERFGKYPNVAQFDEGKEFYNVGVRDLLTKNNIKYFSTNSERKAAIVESVGDYALKEPKLIYKSIESQNMYSQAAAEYADTDFPFVDISYLKPTNWGKNQTSVVESVNVPRRSMRAIVMLFKHTDTVDSEEYIYPNITKVDVTIDG